MMINKCRFLSLLSVLALGAVAPSPASANVLCKNMDAKQIHLRAASYTLFGEFDTPWVTFQSAATPADCHRCLRAYDAQLALLGTAIPAIASPRSHNHEARAAVLQLLEASADTLAQCRLIATEKPLKRLSLCKEWRGTTTKYLQQILLSQLTSQPFTAHQLLFWRIGSLVRECALDR